MSGRPLDRGKCRGQQKSGNCDQVFSAEVIPVQPATGGPARSLTAVGQRLLAKSKRRQSLEPMQIHIR